MEPRRMIYVPGAEQWVAVGQYVQAVKTAKANPEARFPYGLTCWWPCTGTEIVEQFRKGMHDRINDGVPYSRREEENVP